MIDNHLFALRLIESNVGEIRDERAAARFNLAVPSLLSQGLIEYAPRRRAAYALTDAGRAALAA